MEYHVSVMGPITISVFSENPFLCEHYNDYYGGVPLKRATIYHDITYVTSMTATEVKSDFKLITEIP